MIIGTGIDVCNIRRIERTLELYGTRFWERLFSVQEQERIARQPRHHARRTAMHFAAKEACAKALGTGFQQGVYGRHMILTHAPSGKPHMILEGGAKERLQAITPPSHEAFTHITLSDEYPYAVASVIMESQPRP